MNESLIVLIVLGLLFLVVVVVGHLGWLALAWFFRLLFGIHRQSPRAAKQACPQCGTSFLPGTFTCARCGWPPSGTETGKNGPLDDLRATARQVAKFRVAGAIAQTTYDRMMLAIEAEERRIAAPSRATQQAAPAPFAQPVVLPPAPAPGESHVPQTTTPIPVSPPITPRKATTSGVADPAQSDFVTAESAGQRIHNVMDRMRAAAGLTKPSQAPPLAKPLGPPMEPPPRAEPRKPFSAMLGAFMEEKNIRWGELVGGFLIIGCSIALVVSQWSTIEQIRILKFFLFPALTAAIFGVGLYTEHRWKLPTTSRSALIIAMLLVPLNFLLIGALSKSLSPTDPQVFAGEAVALAGFLWLVQKSGRVIMPSWSWILTLGVVGCCFSQVIIRRVAGPIVNPVESTALLMAVGSLPLLFYAASIAWMLRRVHDFVEVGEQETNRILMLLGSVSFSAYLAFGLMVYNIGLPGVRELAPLVGLAGMPALASGLMLWRRLTDSKLATVRTAGASIAALGVCIMLAGIALAWPHPSSLLPVALLDFAALATVAVVFSIPAGHLVAAPALVIAYIVAFHLLAPETAWHPHAIGWRTTNAQMFHALFSASTGSALTVLVLLWGAGSELAKRLGRMADAYFYRIVCAATALLSLALVTAYGFGRSGDPYAAWAVYAIYSAVAFAGAWRTGKWQVTWVASGLVLAAIVQGVVFRLAPEPDSYHWQLALLIHATAAIVASVIIRAASDRLAPYSDSQVSTPQRGQESVAVHVSEVFAAPLSLSALSSSWIAIPFWLFAAVNETTGVFAGYTLWIAAIWFVASYLHRLAGLFTVSQLMLALSALLAVTMRLEAQDWFASLRFPLFDPWTLQVQAIALLLLSLFWVGVRIGFRRFAGEAIPSHTRWGAAEPLSLRDRVHGWRGTMGWLLYPPWPPLDNFVTAIVLIGFVANAAYAIVPGVLREFVAPTEIVSIASLAGASHAHAAGIGAWILGGLLLVVLLLGQWEQFERWSVHGMVLILGAACLLVAALFESETASASAWRWLSGGLLLICSIPIWMRNPLRRLVTPVGWPAMADRSAGLTRESRALLFLVTIVPVLSLTLYAAGATVLGKGIAGPAADSFFGRLGDAISYVVPLAAVSVALVGHAVRERSAGFAFAAGLVINLAVTLGYVLGVVTAGGAVTDAVNLVRLAQWNAIAASAFAVGWLLARGWLSRILLRLDPLPVGGLLRLQVAIGLALNLLILVPADIALFLFPQGIRAPVVETGSIPGWSALGMAVISVIWLAGAQKALSHAGVLCACLLAVNSMIAFAMCRWDSGFVLPAGTGWSAAWLGYHTLLVGRVAVAWCILGIGWLMVRRGDRLVGGAGSSSAEPKILAPSTTQRATWQYAVGRWSTVVAVLAVVLAIRNAVDLRDPGSPWWAMGSLMAMSLLMAALARWSMRRGYVYWAGILGNMAASAWCIVELWPARGHVLDTVNVNVIALALPAIAWLALELQLFQHNEMERAGTTVQPQGLFRWTTRGGQSKLPPFHHVAAIVSLLTIASVVAAGLCADAIGHPLNADALLGWTALGSVTAILIACLWDLRARYAMPALFILGLVASGMILDSLDLQSRWLGWTGVIVLAAYSVAAGYLWSKRDGLRALGDGIGIPQGPGIPEAGQGWLVVANQLLATTVVVLCYWIVLDFDAHSLGGTAAMALSLRLTAAKAAMAQALAVGLLAQGARRTTLQKASLWLVAIGAVAWGWAWLEPRTTGNLINRLVVVLTVLAAVTAIYGIGLTKLLKRENEWTRAAQQIMPWLAGLCAGALLLILGLELADTLTIGRVDMAWPAIVVVALTLLGLSAVGIVLAIVPGRDPLQLSERGRMMYVYATEALIGLLFMHIYLTMPWLFRGVFEPYWPLFVVAIAYIGVGLSELFHRQNRLILAEPLQKTGTFLPLLPVLGFWAIGSETHYSMVLVLVGLMYGGLSVTRQSFALGVLASVTANGGLVYLLVHDLGFGWVEHAQIWLIPGALCVLGAAYLNRAQLTEAQFITIRYTAMMVIYVSSTADIFMSGVREAPWLPMVLAVISVAGIFAGILLHVRSFLFLGSSFLMLSLVTMILSAHVNLGWTWLWWVGGISLGIAIILVFALFEKKRHELLLVVDELKHWER